MHVKPLNPIKAGETPRKMLITCVPVSRMTSPSRCIPLSPTPTHDTHVTLRAGENPLLNGADLCPGLSHAFSKELLQLRFHLRPPVSTRRKHTRAHRHGGRSLSRTTFSNHYSCGLRLLSAGSQNIFPPTISEHLVLETRWMVVDALLLFRECCSVYAAADPLFESFLCG